MHSALKPIIRTVIYYLLSVLAIAAVLVVGKLVLEGINGARSARGYLQSVAQVHDGVAQQLSVRTATLTQDVSAAKKLPLAAVDTRIQGLAHRLERSSPQEDGDLLTFLREGPQQFGERLGAHYKAELEREMMRQELAYLQQLRAHLMVLNSYAAARLELERLRREHIAAYAELTRKRREIAQLGFVDKQRIKYPWARSPTLDKLDASAAALLDKNEAAASAFKRQAAALNTMQRVSSLREFTLDQARLEDVVQPLRARLADARRAVAGDWASRVGTPLLQALPVAFGILLLCLLTKFAVRAIFYFWLAPFATRGAPIRLGGRDGKPRNAARGQAHAWVDAASSSAVSQKIVLDPNEELLALPRYLQSMPVGAQISTRWLLKQRWWASLTSGMYLLTCVRTKRHHEEIVVSASDDGMSELAQVRLTAGAALVFHPRALVGLICERNAPLTIERHWRLASLHAWLTMQLRYFVIHGPVTLIVQGTRGVRVAPASGAHSVRQSATLGFSAGVAYSTVRSAPFLPYLRGQTDLFYDRFAGGEGIYIYDETPESGRRSGRLGRGVEGLVDAVLKVFGI